MRWVCGIRSILAIADVTGLGGIESQVADRRDKLIDSEGNECQKHISKGSGCIAFRFQRRVVDDNTADPSKKEGQQKACESFVIHDSVSFRLCNIFGVYIREIAAYNPSTAHRKTQTPIVVTQTNRKRFRTPKSVELAFLPVPYLGVAEKGMVSPV